MTDAVPTKPTRRLIIDTDMLNFDDDPLAIGLANIFQNWGEVELTQWPEFTQYGDYLTGLTYNFTEDLRDGANTPDPVSSYRYLLSTSADNSVTIAVIGFFDNLYHLLRSGPDQISPRTGAELLSTKVRELVVQAGETGRSYNTAGPHNATFAAAVLNWWPGTGKGKLTFASDDVGENTRVGQRITTELDPAANPVGYALRTNIGYNQTHYAWDAVAIYYAVCGLDDVFDWKYPDGGRVTLNASSGHATWQNATPGTGGETGGGLQNSLQFRMPNTTFADRLESTLMWEPGTRVPGRRSWCNSKGL
ncbi:hypothetical protein SLS62_005498 [Diatrype stigma]|uniref:Uncharacterized protein n=1 Tax=Diatrype stigma TaxID=117547 RepID=A0AAN9UUS6_9PEZI